MAAQAEEWIRPGTETWNISAGVFLPEFDTKIRVNNTNVDGGLGVDLEDQLNLKKRNETGYVDLKWRFFEKHRLGIGWFRLGRDASATATGDIEIGDGNIINAGATAYTELNMDVIPFSYAYSFINNDKHELSGFIGIHWTDIEFLIDASAWADKDGSGPSGQARLTASAAAPLPLFGLNYRYNFSRKWTGGIGAGYFSLSMSEDTSSFSGSLYNFRADTEYWFWKNVGLGAAINSFGIDVDVSDSDWHGNLEYKYWGPQLYLRARF
jgi:hypothetical protein